jgi:hypothetical protein
MSPGYSAVYGVPPFILNGAGNFGTTMAATTIGGLAASFSGATDAYLQKASSIGTFVASPFTVSIWCYETASSGGSKLWVANQGGGFNGYYLQIVTATPQWQAFDGSTGSVTPTSNVTLNTWQHITAIEYSSTSRACFLNGASKGTDTTSITPGLVKGNVFETLAAQSDGTGRFTGLIADVRIYNRALTDAEVWALYDPRSRWDLYWQPNTRAYSFMSAIAAGTAGYLLVKN